MVYGNEGDANKHVTFRIYDADKGVVYSDVLCWKGRIDYDIKFTSNQLLGNYDSPMKWTATNLIEQVIDLKHNWNWMSINVRPIIEFDVLNNLLGKDPAFFCIKDKPGNISFLEEDGWEGTLAVMMPGEMYKVRMANDCLGKTIQGLFVNPKETSLTIHPRYNWIGSLSIFNLSLNDAFADLQPLKGDYVVAKDGVAFYNGFMWEGTLQSIIPGRGYVYFSSAEEEKSFHFPNVETDMQANTAMFDGYDVGDWTPFTPVDHHNFSDNMNVIATLNDGNIPVDTAWVAAYIDNECRGVTKAIKGIYYITVAANAEEAGKLVNFRTFYDGEVKAIQENVEFMSDAIDGDPENPVTLTIGNGLGIDEMLYAGINITPVKTQRMVHVSSEKPLRNVDVFSTVGMQVKSLPVHGNQTDIDLLTLADGVYLVKAVDLEGNMTVKRIIKTSKAE
jgi:hypothetical protein